MRIDAIILRAFEMDNNFHQGDLVKYIKTQYGIEVDLQERLKIYHNPDTGHDFSHLLN